MIWKVSKTMKYEKPEIKMFKFEIEDVITTSGFDITTTVPSTPPVIPTIKDDHGYDIEDF